MAGSTICLPRSRRMAQPELFALDFDASFGEGVAALHIGRY